MAFTQEAHRGGAAPARARREADLPAGCLQRRGLLALKTGSGRAVYPLFQFVAGRPVDGLADVLDAVPEQLASRWTLASWLVTPRAELDGERPVEVLADGSPQPVVRAAREWAAALER